MAIDPYSISLLAPSNPVQPTVQAVNPIQALTQPTDAPTPVQPSGLTQEDVNWKARHSGVAGVARTILGGLGDFLLSRLHAGTPYHDSQRQHELNYAFDQGGQSSDPQAQMNAIDNVQKVDFQLGAKLRDQYIDNQRLQAAQAATNEAREARLANVKQAQQQGVLGRAASYFNNLSNLPEDKREAAYQAGRALWSHSSSVTSDPDLQAQLEQLYPDKYDPDLVQASIGASVPVAAQWKQKTADTKLSDTRQYRDRKMTETERHDQATESNTQRGQDMSAGTAAAGRSVTMRGQDLSHADRVSGQAAANTRATNRDAVIRRGQDMKNARQKTAIMSKYGLK